MHRQQKKIKLRLGAVNEARSTVLQWNSMSYHKLQYGHPTVARGLLNEIPRLIDHNGFMIFYICTSMAPTLCYKFNYRQ